MGSTSGETTVHEQVVTGDEGSSGRAQPDDGGRDFRRRADAADGMLRRVSVTRLGLSFAEERFEARCANAGRRNAVHANPLLREFERLTTDGGAKHSPQSKGWMDKVKDFFE